MDELDSPFAQAAQLAWIEAVYEAALPLVGMDIELVSRGPHTENPVRGRLLRVGNLRDRQPVMVTAFFGVGHLVVRPEDSFNYSTLNVHPFNVLSIKAVPTVRNVELVMAGAA